jgi:CheY-like chemotaxis protein
MDMMMPELDGIQATQQIRGMPEFAKLPIISLTAKAMKGDREKALSAGASDYITKPVDPERLLSVMHVWMQKTGSKQMVQ